MASGFTNYSDFNKPYTSVSSVDDNNYSNMNVNNFYKQDLPEFMLYQDNRTHNKYRGTKSKRYPSSNENRVTATKGILCEFDADPVAELFFSNENMNRIQKMIRRDILVRSNGQFRLDVDQDESDLLIAMRAVFFSKYGARFLPFKITHQVKELNKKVINYVCPDLYSNVLQDYGYIKEINSEIRPLLQPICTKVSRTLPSLTTVYTR